MSCFAISTVIAAANAAGSPAKTAPTPEVVPMRPAPWGAASGVVALVEAHSLARGLQLMGAGSPLAPRWPPLPTGPKTAAPHQKPCHSESCPPPQRAAQSSQSRPNPNTNNQDNPKRREINKEHASPVQLADDGTSDADSTGEEEDSTLVDGLFGLAQGCNGAKPGASASNGCIEW